MPKKTQTDAFSLSKSETIKRYGSYVDLGPCLISRNLNLLTLRGAARIDMLAIISSADEFDMKDNKTGTQRGLDAPHAEACFEYALDSVDIPSVQEARAFPEVMLNVRELSAIEFYNLEDPGEVYELSSYMSEDDLGITLVGVRVNLEYLELPPPLKNPPISRFDGNHRLSGMDRHLEEYFATDEPATTYDLPFIPFSLFVGVETNEEKRLFNVINNEHKGMEPALLDAQIYDLTSEEKLKNSPKLLPLWIARKLTEDGRAFEGKVFFGGSTKGIRDAGLKLPIRFSSLRAAIAIQIKTGGVEIKSIVEEPDLLLKFINNYWSAVKTIFFEAWENKREYILLQSIGLNGFAMLGGKLIKDAVEVGSIRLHQSDFEANLAAISSQVSLDRKDAQWDAVAGAGGARKVYEKLVEKLTPSAANLAKLKAAFLESESTEELLSQA